MADKIYFTITGTGFFEGDEFFEKDMEVLLEKEPDNKYDHEAILDKKAWNWKSWACGK